MAVWPGKSPLYWEIAVKDHWTSGHIADTLEGALPVIRAFYDELAK